MRQVLEKGSEITRLQAELKEKGEILKQASGFIRQYEFGDSQQIELCIEEFKRLEQLKAKKTHPPNVPESKPQENMENISKQCEGERCNICDKQATNKIGEEIMFDDPMPNRHNLTAYVCKEHFNLLFISKPEPVPEKTARRVA
jgi:hypothetical protein